MPLRDYQVECKNRVLGELTSDRQSTLVVMPTGTGKTEMFLEVARDWIEMTGRRVLILAHREELIFQPAERIERQLGFTPAIEMAEFRAHHLGLYNGDNRIVLSTVQTMARERRRLGFDPATFGLVIIDEAHHAPAETYRRILDYYGQNPDLRVLGVTATPDRADREALGKVFESVAFEYDLPRAIDDGWLVQIDQQYVVVAGLDFSQVRTTAGDLNEADLEAVLLEERMLHEVVTPTVEAAGGEPTLVFATSIRHAQRLAEILNRHRDGSAVCITGRTDREERRHQIVAYQTGKVQFLVSCGVFLEGFDAPAASVISMARPTKSRSLYAQALGRGTRPLPGTVDGKATPEERRAAIKASKKPRMLVLDFVGNSGRHKLVSSADILGGRYSDDIVAAAVAQLRAQGGHVVDALENAEVAINEARLVKELAREVAARVKRRLIVAEAHWSSRRVDPFCVSDLAPGREPGWHRGRRPTDKQLAFLRRNGVEVDGTWTFQRASRTIALCIERRKRGLCTYKQSKLLAKFGYDTWELTFADASGLITMLKRNGWRRPAEALAEA